MNTKFDYIYLKDNNQNDWQAKWYSLLNGRFVVENNELIEDSNAHIFRLGFTVAEVADAIGFTGYTQREKEWYTSFPDRYQLQNGKYTQAADWPVKRLASVKAELQQANKTACTNHILARYPLTMQQSASLGVYPADVRDTITDFVGRCIAEENRLFDLAEAAATDEQLSAITPVWPEE
jgi:hypothetical protein